MCSETQSVAVSYLQEPMEQEGKPIRQHLLGHRLRPEKQRIGVNVGHVLHVI